MMFRAEKWGLRERGANPCLGIAKNPRNDVAWFLDTGELARLGRALDAGEARWPDAVPAIRLLAPTGCRRSEVLNLRWRDIGADAINLADSKTGPRAVPLARTSGWPRPEWMPRTPSTSSSRPTAPSTPRRSNAWSSACALKHHTRRGGRGNDKWQIASRLATAPILEVNDIWLPPQVASIVRLMHGTDDLPVERIYERIPDSDDRGGGDQGASPPTPGQSKEQNQNGSQQNDGQGDGSDDDPMPGEVQDAPEEQRDEQDRTWDRASKQAIQTAKATGSEPGNVEQVFAGMHDHRRDWVDILHEYMCVIAPNDFTWSRPNRRLIDEGLYLPLLSGEGMGPLVVAVDTSGSVDDDHVNRACAEIFEIAREVKPERVYVIQCDTKVRDVIDFHSDEAPDEITISGRGGTSFQPVFDYIAEHGIDPDVLIYMTDLEGPMPVEPPFPVIWAVENEGQAGDAPFGQSLVVDMI